MTTPTININGKEYTESDLTQEQIFYVKHIFDLDAQIAQMSMRLDQLNVAKSAITSKLTATLEVVENATE